MARDYNYIYSKLVEDENDIVGHIAYSLYKSEKVSYISKFKGEHKREPNEDELKPFHDVTCMPSQLDGYRLKATTLLQLFLGYTAEERIKELEDGIKNDHVEILRGVVKEIGKIPKERGFLYGLSQSFFGSLIFFVAMIGIFFALSLSKMGYRFSFGPDGNPNVEITEKSSTDVRKQKCVITTDTINNNVSMR